METIQRTEISNNQQIPSFAGTCTHDVKRQDPLHNFTSVFKGQNVFSQGGLSSRKMIPTEMQTNIGMALKNVLLFDGMIQKSCLRNTEQAVASLVFILNRKESVPHNPKDKKYRIGERVVETQKSKQA